MTLISGLRLALRQQLWTARSRAFLENIQEFFKQIVDAVGIFRFQDLFTKLAPITPGALTHRNTSEVFFSAACLKAFGVPHH
jgi:hypothetical protein